MKIFVSWSGERSKHVAEALRQWLPDVLQFVRPWMSGADIEAGARWSQRIQKELQESQYGILCVTRDNLSAPWLLFEAGALAKAIDDTLVCPYLIDLEASDIPSGPLTQFQAKRASITETKELILSINQASDTPLEKERVDRAFERCWPDLERKLESIPESSKPPSESKRSTEEMLKEILLAVRRVESNQTQGRRRSNLAQPSVWTSLAETGAQVELWRDPSLLAYWLSISNLDRDYVKVLYNILRDKLAEQSNEGSDEIEGK